MPPSTTSSPVSAVIPNWNGAYLLRQNLPALLAEIASADPQSECIVVDDGSTDESRELLRESFPSVRLIEQRRNLGFSSAVNAGIRAARHERLLLINNDVQIRPGFLLPLQIIFDQHPDTFAAAAMQEEKAPNGEKILDGFNAVRWRSGFFELSNRTLDALQGKEFSLSYCTAGCSLFSREKLLALGGFCELFDPFYYEDAELSLQAVRRGWRVAFAPDSVVEHRHGSSARKKPWKLKVIPSRNYFFLHWLLLDSPSLWLRHLLGIMVRIVGWIFQGRLILLVGLAAALTELPRIAIERRRRGRGATRRLQIFLSEHFNDFSR